MANAVAMVIADGQATPVNVTFTPWQKDAKGVYWFADVSEPNPLFRRVISVSMKAPAANAKDRKYTVLLRTYDPTPDITSPTTGTGIQPAPSKAYDVVSEQKFLIPERSVLQERKDMRAFARNLLANSQIIDLLENFINVT